MTTTSRTPHQQVVDAVDEIVAPIDWEAIFEIVTGADRDVPLLGNPREMLLAQAARAALEVERRLGMPGLAELVARHEWLKTRSRDGGRVNLRT